MLFPAGDRLFGPDRVARGNPQCHIHKLRGSPMQCVVPEKDSEKVGQRRRLRESSEKLKNCVGVSPPAESSFESEEDPLA